MAMTLPFKTSNMIFKISIIIQILVILIQNGQVSTALAHIPKTEFNDLPARCRLPTAIQSTRSLNGSPSDNGEYCQLQPYQPHQSAYYGFPYDLTFTMKFSGFSCDDLCMVPALFCFLRNNKVADSQNNTIVSRGLSCSTAYSRCCLYNITLRIRKMSKQTVGKYDFRFAGHSCGCSWYKQAIVNLQAKECINLGIVQSDRMGNDTDLSTTIKCTAKGIPRPSVQWAKCHHGQCRSHLFPSQNIQIINETTVVATLKIDRNNPNQIGNISCRSVNLCQSLLSRKIWNVQRPSVSTLATSQISDNVCKLLLPAQPHQLAYFGLPYDITFTMQYQGCQCGVDCTYQASFYFKRKNIIINDGTNTKISSNFACPNSSWPCSNSSSKPYLGCCQRNITLRIQNVTVDDLGEYQFEYYGVHCQCIQGMKASINLQAQECINSGIILSARKDKEKDSSVTFSCFARGNPRPQIQWTKCNQTQCLPYPFRFQRTKVINDTTTVSTLTIYRTEGEDLGNISCQSVNPCKTVPGHQSWTVKSSSTIKIILIITFGSSTGLVSIVVLIVVFIPDRRTKLSYFTKVMMATKIKTDKEKILIIRHCYTQPAVDLTTTIVSQLKRYFDGQIMTMFNNAPYDIHPTIYLKFIRHFRMVVLLHEDQVEEGNEMKCQHFIPCVKSIIDDCISTGGIPILPILINDPRNYPDNLDQMECLTWDEKWNDDDQENFKQELHDTIYNCYHGLCPSYLHTSISNLSDTNDDNDDETTVLMHSGYEN